MEKNQIIGVNAYAVINDEEEALDIDTLIDFTVVESVMRYKRKANADKPN